MLGAGNPHSKPLVVTNKKLSSYLILSCVIQVDSQHRSKFLKVSTVKSGWRIANRGWSTAKCYWSSKCQKRDVCSEVSCVGFTLAFSVWRFLFGVFCLAFSVWHFLWRLMCGTYCDGVLRDILWIMCHTLHSLSCPLLMLILPDNGLSFRQVSMSCNDL